MTVDLFLSKSDNDDAEEDSRYKEMELEEYDSVAQQVMKISHNQKAEHKRTA